MNRIKSIVAVCVIIAIITACAIISFAAISFSTSVYWGPMERSAWAESVATGTTGCSIRIFTYIQSRSTGQYREKIVNSINSGSVVTATTDPVDITYPSEIPLVNYGGYTDILE